jgi:ribosomal protein S21
MRPRRGGQEPGALLCVAAVASPRSRPAPERSTRHRQVEIAEEEPEDVAVRRYMKAVMQSGVINKVRRRPQQRRQRQRRRATGSASTGGLQSRSECSRRAAIVPWRRADSGGPPVNAGQTTKPAGACVTVSSAPLRPASPPRSCALAATRSPRLRPTSASCRSARRPAGAQAAGLPRLRGAPRRCTPAAEGRHRGRRERRVPTQTGLGRA